MPNRDGTGPDGAGPRTGRGLGPCRTGTSGTRRSSNLLRRGTSRRGTIRRGRPRNRRR